jgi:hypothetical protein
MGIFFCGRRLDTSLDCRLTVVRPSFMAASITRESCFLNSPKQSIGHKKSSDISAAAMSLSISAHLRLSLL